MEICPNTNGKVPAHIGNSVNASGKLGKFHCLCMYLIPYAAKFQEDQSIKGTKVVASEVVTIILKTEPRWKTKR